MPRRKYSDTYRPHSGTTPARPVTRGVALDDQGKPIRLENFHTCGETLFRGYRDFDTAHWRHSFHASRRQDAPAITRCPRCRAELSRENVRALLPDEPDPQETAAAAE